jgi:hypothetical protein
MNDAPIDFLRDRVKEINSALFFNESPNPILLPTCIISATAVDEEGYISFFMTRSCFYLPELDHHFPARLDFYRKGKPFFLKIKGEATIITNEKEMGIYQGVYVEKKQKTNQQLMLVKVKIDSAEYYEMKEHLSWWEKMLELFAGWIPDKKGAFAYIERPFSYN